MPQFENCHIGIRLSNPIPSAEPETGLYHADEPRELIPLEEYGTQVVGSTVTTWIASESGKEFEIIFKGESYPCSLQLVIFVDGIELVNRGYDQRKMGMELVCQGVSIDANTVKPFVFSDIVFPENDTAFDHMGLGDVGTIRIELLQVVFSESRNPKYVVPSLSNDPNHKSSCISGARGVRLGEQKRFRTRKVTSTPYDPANPGPIAIFKYIYRPRGMLISQGIIPTYVPRFVEHLESLHSPNGRERDVGREEAIRRLREQQEQVQRELKELEDLRRLRERQAELQRDLDALENFENFGFGNE